MGVLRGVVPAATLGAGANEGKHVRL